MNVYFIVICILEALSLLVSFAMHGERRQGSYNFFLKIVDVVFQMWLFIMAIKVGF